MAIVSENNIIPIIPNHPGNNKNLQAYKSDETPNPLSRKNEKYIK